MQQDIPFEKHKHESLAHFRHEQLGTSSLLGGNSEVVREGCSQSPTSS